jgi:hypothetical protein
VKAHGNWFVEGKNAIRGCQLQCCLQAIRRRTKGKILCDDVGLTNDLEDEGLGGDKLIRPRWLRRLIR